MVAARRQRRRLQAAAVFAAAGLIAAACGNDSDDDAEADAPAEDDVSADETDGDSGGEEAREYEEGTPMAEFQDAGEVVIGVKFDVPPFGFLNPQSDEVEGFDVDMGKYIADKLGVEANFIEAISDNRIPFLGDGTVDIILSTMTITTDRDAEVDFSRPYVVATGELLVPEDSDIAGIEDLTQGTSVCTAIGSTYEEALREQAPDARLDLVDSHSECMEKLQNDSVDALSTDDMVGAIILSEDESLKLVEDPLTTDPLAAGIAEGESELQEFLDTTIEEAFEDGTWDEIFHKWVGQYTGQDEPTQDPREWTREDALELFPCEETC